jgi:nicotinamidase-related amidase
METGRGRHRSWEARFSEKEIAIFDLAGYGRRIRLGDKPALLLVDTTINFTGDRPEDITQSIRRFPDSCGENAWEAVPAIVKLLRYSRRSSIPVIYTKGPLEKNAITLGGWAKSRRRMDGRADDAIGESFLGAIAPVANEIVFEKRAPSAFFETPLTSTLIGQDVNTVVIAGATTSGCVRATVVDAFSLGYRVAVVEEATFDRSDLSRDVSLFDMDQKYAQVLSLSQAIRYFGRVRRTTATHR